LLGGNSPQAHTFVGEKDRCASEQKLAELQDGIEAPALKKQDAAAEQAHGGEKDVVIAGEGGLEAPHEIKQCTAHRKHYAHDAGPIQAGINHGVSPDRALSQCRQLSPSS
jgi:hypothetical protein